MLRIRNPHSILAALKNRPRDVARIDLGKGAAKSGGVWSEISSLASQNRVQIGTGEPDSRPQKKGEQPEGGRTGGSGSALIRPKPEASQSELLQLPDEGEYGVWLALDCIQDPHNLGAIFRTASFFGIRGVVLSHDRSATLTEVAYDVSAGGVEALPFMTVTNLRRTLDDIKESGIWILGTSERAQESLFSIKADRNWILVLGNEESGMRRLTEEVCDMVCGIPPLGEVQSLNVSVAAGICLSNLRCVPHDPF